MTASAPRSGGSPPVRSVFDAIGGTPLVELLHVVPARAARVVAKLESAGTSGATS